MFVLELREASAGLRTQDEVDAIVRRLASRGFRPVLRQMVQSGYEAAGLGPSTEQLLAILGTGRRYRALRPESAAIGELFFGEGEAYVLNPTENRLHAWAIRYHRQASAIDDFCKAVADAATSTLDGRRLRGMDFTWKSAEPSLRDAEPPMLRAAGRRADRLKSRTPEYSPQEAANARLLSKTAQRQFLLRLAQVRGKARSVDADQEAGLEIVQPLLDAALVGREYLVICKQDSHTICSLQEKEQLASGALSGARCSICGRGFGEELIQDIFALSEAGSKLLAKSHWMTIWITELLKEAGIAGDRISWNAASGDDEIDVIADVFGTKVFFELKDREFGVGDAYPFLYRVERYGGSFGVVISTDRVAEEVKRVFAERAPGVGAVPIQTLEGADRIASDLAALVDQVSRIPANRVVAQFAEAVDLNPVPILRAWMDLASRQRMLLPAAQHV